VKKSLVALVAVLVAASAAADEATIRRVLDDKLGDGARVVSIQPAPVAGLFEVHFVSREGPQILYTDENAEHILLGTLYDVRQDRNLTEERMRRLTAIDFNALPLDLAVRVQRGNGRRVLAVFSDPYCPACRQFEQVLKQVDDITIYYFMYPVIRPELVAHSKAVWCSPDRAKAWIALATQARPQPPTAKPDCPTPLDRVLELGHALGVNSTPTLFFTTGERVRGGMHAAALVAQLDEASQRAKRK
jgi:thiol:disulfide interchange protein DsbC